MSTTISTLKVTVKNSRIHDLFVIELLYNTVIINSDTVTYEKN